MHNDFYASGFLFHYPTQQILLQKTITAQDQQSQWTLFVGKKEKEEKSSDTFHRVIVEQLKLNLPNASIFSVYDYIHEKTGHLHFVHYGQIDKLREFVIPGALFSWFTFKQITKLPMSQLTRQDITVGQRVINLVIRNASDTVYT